MHQQDLHSTSLSDPGPEPIPFRAIRAGWNRDEVIGLVQVTDRVHWIKLPGALKWTGEYSYKAISKAEYNTYKALGVPVCKVKYKWFRRWLAAESRRTRLLYVLSFGMIGLIIGTVVANTNIFAGISVYVQVGLYVLFLLSIMYFVLCFWADTFN